MCKSIEKQPYKQGKTDLFTSPETPENTVFLTFLMGK
jgi:hypothetical protein